MADCKSASDSIEPSRLKFMGPIQQEFESLQDQATYFLDLYFPNWKSSATLAQGYMIPPIFEFKHPDVCDEVIENLKENKNLKKPCAAINDRQGEEAEYLMYSAVQKLISENARAPFLAVHSLDINKHISRFPKIFPPLDWNEILPMIKECFREYDFVIIGPEIGLVVIEVKSSKYEGYFECGTKSLPADYKKGLRQLNSTEKLVDLLQIITGITRPKIVTKILFAANVHKSRYEHWKCNLNDDQQVRLLATIGDVFQLFGGDSLQLSLMSIIETCSVIPQQVYESYAPLIAGLSSITLLSSSMDCPIAKLDNLNFSFSDCILKDSTRIKMQNPIQDLKRSKLHASALMRVVPKEQKLHSRVVFLSPDQKAALIGHNRQFLLGAPGTGKTIILQTKALELLARGDSVTVLTPECYRDLYRILFNTFGHRNYKILYWPENHPVLYQIGREHEDAYTRNSPLPESARKYNLAHHIFEYIHRSIATSYESFCTLFEWFLTSDHIIIDDVLDLDVEAEPGYFFFYPMITMVIAKLIYPEKVVWSALDSYLGPGFGRPGNIRIISQLLDSISPAEETVSYFSVAILRHVMRCSENIFTDAYPSMSWEHRLRPSIGHKIKGCEITRITKQCNRIYEASSILLNEIKIAIQNLIQHGIQVDQMAVIVGSAVWFLLGDGSFENAHISIRVNGIKIRKWDSVSSLEWPVVIYANYIQDKSPPRTAERIAYQRYRAVSRAIVKLIDITFMYEERTSSPTSRKSGLDQTNPAVDNLFSQ